MYDLQSSPMPATKTLKTCLKKHFFDMARLIHQPFQQPTNVKMAWSHSDDPLTISVMKRTSKISKLGESLEIEAIDDFEANLAKASRRYVNNNSGNSRISKVITPDVLASPKGAASSSVCPNAENDVVIFDGHDDDIKKDADEISLELKLYDQGPVYLTDLGSAESPPPFRSRTRRSLRYRPSSRISDVADDDVDAESPSSFDQVDDDEDRDCDASDMMSDDEDDDNNFHLSDSDHDCEDEREEEPQYEMVPPIWCMMQPGQRLSTIYVKPAVACFDLTDVSPGMYSMQSQT